MTVLDVGSGILRHGFRKKSAEPSKISEIDVLYDSCEQNLGNAEKYLSAGRIQDCYSALLGASLILQDQKFYPGDNKDFDPLVTRFLEITRDERVKGHPEILFLGGQVRDKCVPEQVRTLTC